MNTSELLKKLPSMEHEFQIEVTGIATGVEYKGQFRYRIPNISKNSQISIMEARLNAGMADTLDPTMKWTHYMISYLKHTLDPEYLPNWWIEANYGMELYDPNVVTAIYQKCMDFEKEWETKVHGRADAQKA